MLDRVIGKFQGEEGGPLLVVFGGIHGNEPAGVRALDLIFKMLEVEPVTNPAFEYKGTLLGIIGNRQSFILQQRFITRDLNRIWKDDNVERILNTDKSILQTEALELREILDLIHAELASRKYSKLVVLDMHTTSSYGGIFTLPTNDSESLRIALELHAPVIRGMVDGIEGTTLHYFRSDNFDLPTVAVVFESGQHNEDLSVNRAIAAIINCMSIIDAVKSENVENRHDSLLIEYSKNLPMLSQLHSIHSIAKGDKFRMLPKFKNFQKVSAGEALAKDQNGIIKSPVDAMIIMPLYQEKGEDGFFLVQKIEGY